MEDRLGVVVATKAFGLGIDKANLRMVVHYALPLSIESYVQESGRAGREGKPAWGILLYRLEDRRIQAFFKGGKYPRREESAQVYREIVRPMDDKSGGSLTLKRLSAATGIAEARLKGHYRLGCRPWGSSCGAAGSAWPGGLRIRMNS